MSVKVKHISRLMEQIAPLDLAEDWDNIGLLLGSEGKDVYKVLVTLDVSGDVVDEAIREDIDLIISHHPIIFKPISSIGQSIEDRNIIYPLIQNEIAVYSAHTNLDKADRGVDDTLAKLLGLKDIKVLDCETGLGRVGKLEQALTAEEYAQTLAEVLEAEDLYIIGNRERVVETVVSCAGAGGGFARQAAEAGADVFVTGEAKYHDSLLALESGLPLILPGHYETEAPAMDELARRLKKEFDTLRYDVEVLSSKAQYKIKRTL